MNGDAMLRIQVRVAAREATQQLRVLAATMKQIQAASASTFKAPNINTMRTQRQINAQAKAAAAAQKAQAAAQKAANAQALAQQKAANAAQAALQRQAQQQALASQKAAAAQRLQAQQAANAQGLALSRSYISALNAQQASMQKVSGILQASMGQKAVFNTQSSLGGALSRLDTAINGTMVRMRQGMLQFGKNMQWIGRQINYNFTLPLIAAISFMSKWTLANESAMTRVAKVYGETGQDYSAELERVGYAMRLLSDRFGENQDQVIELAARWAAAGLVAGDLAKAVENSLKLSVIGDYEDLTQTFDDLVTIQSAFNLNSEEMAKALAILNTTENMTAATMQDLVTGITKVGGAAAVSGVDIRHLSAMMAALVPSTGSAATAGTALQTILSRLMQPTADIIEVLDLMGIAWSDSSFQALNASERLEFMARTFDDLTNNQQAYVASVIASRRQYNKLVTLLQDMADAQGNYQRVLDATNQDNATKNMAELNKELDIFLSSTPKRLEIITTQMKNFGADIAQAMLPALVGLVSMIRQAVGWFARLSPSIQKVIFMLGGIAVITGVLAQAYGSFQLLFGTMIKGVLGLLHMLGIGTISAAESMGLASAQAAAATATAAAAAAEANFQMFLTSSAAANMTGQAYDAMLARVTAASTAAQAATSAAAGAQAAAASGGALLFVAKFVAIAAAVAALVVLIVKNWDTIKEVTLKLGHGIADIFQKAVRAVVDAFGLLPKAIIAVFNAIGRIISAAIKGIRDALSYLNPFARHSPSLVDNVKAGVAVIAREYASLASSFDILGKAADDLERFMEATAAARNAARVKERGDQRASIVSASPGAGPATDALYSDLDALYLELDRVSAAIAAQEEVIRPLEQAYKAADYAVQAFEASMAPLAATVAYLEKQLDAANKKMSELANTPIAGMKAMDDAIWENAYAQKELRLEILKLKQAGQSYDDISAKLAALNGDIESTRATMTDLRQAGAGSDVLAAYQAQLDALEEQKAGLSDSAAAALDLQKQLDDLDLAGQILQLERDITFDPLIRQIDDLTNTTQEMSFEDIIAGITEQRQVIDDLTAAYEPQKAALDEQQKALDELILKRDLLKAAYDAEMVTLDMLNDQYDQIEQKIRDIESALSDAAQAADTLSGAGGGGGGGGSIWDDLTGLEDVAAITPTDTVDLESLIAEWESQLSGMFKIDIKKWFLDLWNKFKDWFMNSLIPATKRLVERLGDALGRIGAVLWNAIKSGLSAIAGAVGGAVMDYIVNPIINLWNKLPFADAVEGAFGKIGAALSKFGELIKPAVEAFGHIVNAGKVVVKVIGGILTPAIWEIAKAFELVFGWIMDIIGPAWNAITAAISSAWNIIYGIFRNAFTTIINIVKPIFDTVVAVISGALDLIRNVIKFFLDLINGDWGKAWDDIVGALKAVWDTIYAVIEGAFKIIYALLKGAVTGIIDIFKGIWNAMVDVGKSIVQGLWDGIKSMWNTAWNWIKSIPRQIIDGIKNLFGIHSPSSVFFDIGMDIMQGLLDGVKNLAKTVLRWFTDLPGNIVKAIGNMGNLLLDIGKSIINSLWDGMKTAWDKVTGWLSGIGGWIKKLKGPIEDDRQLLVEEGRAIMQGLQKGMQDQWDDVVSPWLKGLGPEMGNAVTQSVVDIMKYIDQGGELGPQLSGIIGDALRNGGTAQDVAEVLQNILSNGGGFWSVPLIMEVKNLSEFLDLMNGIASEKALLELQQSWGDLADVIDRNNQAVKDGQMTQEEAAIANRLAVLSQEQAVSEYLTEVLKLPPEVTTEVLTLMNDGDYMRAAYLIDQLSIDREFTLWAIANTEDAEAAIRVLERDRSFNLTPILTGPAAGGIGKHSTGAIIPGTPQGRLAIVGEGGFGRDEVIIPLTNASRAMTLMQQSGLLSLAAKSLNGGGVASTASLGGGNVNNRTELHFHGDLSFPGITDGEDAEAFVSNLEMLAGV